jgi:serine/threonine protein kinase
MNLYDFIKGNQFQGLSLSLIKRFAVQILQTLVLLYDSRIIHCDLKPENILLKQPNRSAVKVIDFGSSCFIDKRVFTYIQSRFYRAPEVILGLPYTMAIDMWSFGCILCELLTGYPIFPGESESEQLLCIMEFLGPPPFELISKASRSKIFFDENNFPKTFINSKGKKRVPGSKKIRQYLRNSDKGFVKLIKMCFVWEPSDRITPQEALACEWIADHSKAKPVTTKNIEVKGTKKTSKAFLFS